jgi:glutamate synthase (NADPH/NADH) small chain
MPPVGVKFREWQIWFTAEKWKEAYDILTQPTASRSFTVVVCSGILRKIRGVLAIHDEAVTIREKNASTVEQVSSIWDTFQQYPEVRTGKERCG